MHAAFNLYLVSVMFSVHLMHFNTTMIFYGTFHEYILVCYKGQYHHLHFINGKTQEQNGNDMPKVTRWGTGKGT